MHSECRKIYTDPKRRMKRKRNEKIEVKRKRIRSSNGNFDREKCCFYCFQSINFKSGNRTPFCKVETVETRESILQKCNERSDDWGNQVRTQVLSCIDLVAPGAVYHTECSSKFRLGKFKSLISRNLATFPKFRV